MHEKSKSENLRLFQILAGAVLFAAALIAKLPQTVSIPLFAASYLIIGAEILLKAVRNIVKGEIFDENFLMTVASLGAFVIGERAEAVAVMLFYQAGEFLQDLAVERSRKSIAALMDLRPDHANVLRGDQFEQTAPESLVPGDILLIKPGEKVPTDCVVTEGDSAVDASRLTGESLPRDVSPGDTLAGGCINLNGALRARVITKYGDSAAARILRLVENAAEKKARSERFITKFARYYTPAVVALAALLAFLPPLIADESPAVWGYRALVFLVVSCPCALVISIPLSFFGGIGGASRNGILVKGGHCLEALAAAKTVVFDKTGTLTQGVFKVRDILPEHGSEARLLELAALAEHHSNHPISLSLREAYGKEPDTSRIGKIEEIPGCGVSAEVDGKTVLAGNAKLMALRGLSVPPDPDGAGTVVHVAEDGAYAGRILIADEPKTDAAQGIRALKKLGIRRLVMLTGDSEAAARRVADELQIPEFRAELLPEDKVNWVEEAARRNPEDKLIFAGDGINDAPVLTRADIGVAMGGLGSDAAIEAADVVLMTDEPSKIADAVRISRKTLQIVKENIILALGTKGIVLAAAAAGHASMWLAVFADVGVALLAVLNALRLLRNLKTQI